ncbi:SMI1/KNR4 family protein [Fulvivirgaceae bacterium BMA12]|uniref:SMI1/KNR4 family protein n=1 Tax=Agaribacillus aureus TaxID=3051825 RepID=A0ABT8LDD8_9BACT|nr:SMI1/KNR4 family protein [Fulvivirgaceae bacterium BMA12]
MEIDNFIKKLKDFGSKVTISPLTEVEVTRIETILNRKLPGYYREFLLKVGLKQDVVWGLIERIEDFDPLEDFLPEGESKRFFRFGHNGGEDYWLLRNDDPNDKTIYEYDYYGDYEIKSLNKTFDDLLDEASQQLVENQDKLVDNSRKVWAVQFSIATNDENEIIDALKDEFGCILSKGIENTEVSPAGVICSEGKIELHRREILLKKQEYKDWETALYYFDWRESVSEMNTNSLIKRIEKQLKTNGLKVTLIDYGIMDSTE